LANEEPPAIEERDIPPKEPSCGALITGD